MRPTQRHADFYLAKDIERHRRRFLNCIKKVRKQLLCYTVKLQQIQQ